MKKINENRGGGGNIILKGKLKSNRWRRFDKRINWCAIQFRAIGQDRLNHIRAFYYVCNKVDTIMPFNSGRRKTRFCRSLAKSTLISCRSEDQDPRWLLPARRRAHLGHYPKWLPASPRPLPPLLLVARRRRRLSVPPNVSLTAPLALSHRLPTAQGLS